MRFSLPFFFLTFLAMLSPELGSENQDPSRVAHRAAMEALLNDAPGDDASALRVVKELAAVGLDAAEYHLGLLYVQGKVLDQDLAAANMWWERAAEQGFVDAQYKLAHSYRVGRGVTVNPEKAFHWYMKAADQGDADAQSNVASCFATGYGVNRDLKRAVHWYRRTAERGDVQAYASLATILSSKDYEHADLVEAYSWLLLVLPFEHFYSSGPREQMNGLRRTFERILSSEQESIARQKAKEWGETHPDVLGPEVLFEVGARIKP